MGGRAGDTRLSKGVGRAGDSGLSKGGAGQGDSGLSKGGQAGRQVLCGVVSPLWEEDTSWGGRALPVATGPNTKHTLVSL